MKSELYSLMQQRNLDALLVSGGTHENPCMYYLANGAKVGASTLAIKQRSHAPVLIVVGMERDEAAKSGLQVIDRAKYKPSELLAAEAGDALRAHGVIARVQGGQLLLDPRTVGDWPNLMRKSPGIVVNFSGSQ